MADVFISYKREEIAWAARVAQALGEEGFTAFFDLDDDGIHAGEEWDKRLEKELAEARCCVVLWSRASTDSINVRSEARRAHERGLLTPAKINACQAPLGLDALQEADLSQWRGDRADAQWRFLVDRGVALKVGRGGRPPNQGAQRGQAPASPGPKARTRPLSTGPAGGSARPKWIAPGFVAAALLIALAAGIGLGGAGWFANGAASVTPANAALPDARRLPASSVAPVLAPGQQPADFAAFRDCADCLEMVALPGGAFTMGSPSSETGRSENEGQVEINLGRFAISRFPVTRGQYATFATATGRGALGGCYTERAKKAQWGYDPQGSWADPAFSQTDRHPVVCVTWDDANAFAKWMSERTGQTYRLLSEAEYEYANRGGTTTPYWWGTDSNGGCGSANGADATLKRAYPSFATSSCNDGYERTSPVGTFAANPFGLYDTTGNVFSWTADCYNTASAARPRDGRPDSSGDCSSRVLRGGSWLFGQQDLRSAFGIAGTPTDSDNFIGFRLARTVSPSDC